MTIFVQVNERTWLNPADVREAKWSHFRDDGGKVHWGLLLTTGPQCAVYCVDEKYTQTTAKALGVGIVSEPKT